MYEGGMHPNTANSYRDDAYRGEKTYLAGGVTQTGGDVTYDAQGNITGDSRTFVPNTTKVNYVDWVLQLTQTELMSQLSTIELLLNYES
ncbi:hypothetical protein KUH03_12655 [Sphingobacterium sp. E70]|uniref:hypothetical protein n=1 Tax=Sphingobacterium sp. E70 TaxID=2853439 RepID=UPI00211C9475|nr:hypothetical protein [Sphingobacterium sp. E70]ULT27501.1 hypothetical protein KUH03_12655 [Sphingobacterium sp. E70]